ncbi:unnamed protein product [Bursaphelenchus okinawaensis]|uniref:Uncharacterized protein n=1 Tax=Bursaphelenchus okinawaensis TaxID=465554 RepID=A0A811KMU5_9BILA|nr:unnamed protein product [Bursaphelenchus okinawaensis]CAG9106375.1 unnamed protein product [Bursaphelenchus okinawaensis]
MFSYCFYFVLFVGIVSADLLDDVGTYFEPAKINPQVVATIGKAIFDNELSGFDNIIEDIFGVNSMPFRYAFQLIGPMSLVTGAMCPDCPETAESFQEFFQKNKYGLIAAPMSCGLLQFVKPKAVPICALTVAGGLLYLQNSKPVTVCDLFCGNTTVSKRQLKDVPESVVPPTSFEYSEVIPDSYDDSEDTSEYEYSSLEKAVPSKEYYEDSGENEYSDESHEKCEEIASEADYNSYEGSSFEYRSLEYSGELSPSEEYYEESEEAFFSGNYYENIDLNIEDEYFESSGHSLEFESSPPKSMKVDNDEIEKRMVEVMKKQRKSRDVGEEVQEELSSS